MSDNKKSSIKKGSSCYLLNVKQPERAAKRLRLGFRSVAGNLFMTKTNRSLDVSVGLLDMSEGGCGIYTSELLRKGAPVELTLTEPYPLRVGGVVIWSIPVTTKVYNAHFRCRSGIKFLFSDENSRNMVKDFLEKISTDPVEAIRNSLNAQPVVMPPPMPGSPATQAAAPATAPEPTGQGTAPPPADSAPPATSPAPASGAATPAVPSPEGAASGTPSVEAKEAEQPVEAPAAAVDSAATAAPESPATVGEAPPAAPENPSAAPPITGKIPGEGGSQAA